MDIKSYINDDCLIIFLDGELDEFSSSYTRDCLDNAFLNYGYNHVVFDMTNLKFMDSTGIGVLLGRYKKLKSKNKNAYIHNPNSTIEKIINMSGIYEIMPKIS